MIIAQVSASVYTQYKQINYGFHNFPSSRPRAGRLPLMTYKRVMTKRDVFGMTKLDYFET